MVFHQDTLGLGLALGIAVLGAFAGVAILLPSGPPSRISGVVTNFGVQESKFGSFRVAVVQTAEGIYSFPLPLSFDCRVGDRIAVDRRPHWWGQMAGVGVGEAQPCARPTDSLP